LRKWIAKALHIADLEVYVRKPVFLRLLARDLQQSLGQVDADDPTLRPNLFGCWKSGGAGSAADVKNRRSNRQL
jgi:hypothetical protein